MRSWNSFTKLKNSSGFEIATSFVPLTAMAFRFLEPITAPKPLRPAARVLSLIIQAIFESFSPAIPMDATRT
jgi:hypothetical protein